MNDSLVSENEQLRLKLSANDGVEILQDSSAVYAIPNPDSTAKVKYADYHYRYAKVINNTVGSVNNYITLNRGEKDGIKKDMAVISANGVVGRVVNTSAHFATAISILSKKQQVSARLKDGTVSYVSWDGKTPDKLLMKDVPNQIKIHKGDTVFTTDYSFFPGAVPIGVVYKTALVKSKNLQILYIRPSTNFRRLQYVYVVENRLSAERLELEQSSRDKK